MRNLEQDARARIAEEIALFDAARAAGVPLGAQPRTRLNDERRRYLEGESSKGNEEARFYLEREIEADRQYAHGLELQKVLDTNSDWFKAQAGYTVRTNFGLFYRFTHDSAIVVVQEHPRSDHFVEKVRRALPQKVRLTDDLVINWVEGPFTTREDANRVR